MSKYIKKWLLPVCILIIIFKSIWVREAQLLAVVVVLIPVALKGFEVNVSNYLERLFTIIAVLLIIYAILHTIW